MSQKIFQVDSFTDRPFSGNPAAVCILDAPADVRWMQNVAMEMNLAETAFLYLDGSDYNLRWFTPEVEVDLCGHATLASAHILWETGILSPESQARFRTRSGLLTAVKKGEMIVLNFPAIETIESAPSENLVAALGIKPKFSGSGESHWLMELSSEKEIYDVRPDFAAMVRADSKMVIVTSLASTSGLDIVSRFFAPGVGIDEDPVTGFAHCCLGPFWKDRTGRNEFTAWQASARGGKILVSVDGDRVRLGGSAVTVLECYLRSI